MYPETVLSPAFRGASLVHPGPNSCSRACRVTTHCKPGLHLFLDPSNRMLGDLEAHKNANLPLQATAHSLKLELPDICWPRHERKGGTRPRLS